MADTVKSQAQAGTGKAQWWAETWYVAASSIIILCLSIYTISCPSDSDSLQTIVSVVGLLTAGYVILLQSRNNQLALLAIERQSIEQAVAAKLNGISALLTSCPSSTQAAGVTADYTSESIIPVVASEYDFLRQQLKLTILESRIGAEYEWKINVVQASARVYLIQVLGEARSRCELSFGNRYRDSREVAHGIETQEYFDDINTIINYMRHEIRLLGQQDSIYHTESASSLLQFTNKLSSLAAEGRRQNTADFNSINNLFFEEKSDQDRILQNILCDPNRDST